MRYADRSQNGESARSLTLARIISIVLVILLCVSYLAAIPLGFVPRENRFGTPEAIFGGALIIVFALVSQRVYAIKELTFGFQGVSAQFERIEERQRELESEVRALQVALTGLVTKFELMHLQKLASEAPAIVRYGNIMLTELTRLDAMQFINPTDARGLNALREDHGSGLDEFDLKDYVEITHEGREYLNLRAQLDARTAAARLGR